MYHLTNHINKIEYNHLLSNVQKISTENHINSDSSVTIHVLYDNVSPADCSLGGYLVSISKIDSSLSVFKFYSDPSEVFLKSKVDIDSDDLSLSGILDVSDSLYTYGVRRSKDILIDILLNDTPDHLSYPLLKLRLWPSVNMTVLNELKDTLVRNGTEEQKLEYHDIINNLNAMCELQSKSSSKYIIDTSNVSTDKKSYLDFFTLIGYDTSDIDVALDRNILQMFPKMRLWGNQIHNIASQEKFTEENPFEHNDCDNNIMTLPNKDDFNCYSLTSQNFKTFIMQSEDEFIALEYAHPIYKDNDGFFEYEAFRDENCLIRDVISAGITSGEYATTNECSPNYIPTLKWLNNATPDAIRALTSKTLHIFNNEVLFSGEFISHLNWDLDMSVRVLYNTFDLEREGFVENNGDFSLLASNIIKENNTGLKQLRRQIFWTLGGGFEWHRDGYIINDDLTFDSEDRGLDSLSSSKDVIEYSYPLSDTSLILNIPDNVRDDALEQVILSFHDVKQMALSDPKKASEVGYRSYTSNNKGSILTDINLIEEYLLTKNINFNI